MGQRIDKIDPGIAAGWAEREARQWHRNIERRASESIAAIRAYRAGGMSIARLEQIYGKDVVYVALKDEQQ